MTNLDLKAKVQCSDGACGHSTSAIMLPAIFQLTHIVVNDTQLHSNPTRLVPIKTIKSTSDDQITLSCSRSDLEAMQPFVSTGYVAVSTSNKKAGASKTDITNDDPEADTVQEEHVPEGAIDIHIDTQIQATDDSLGKLDGFVVDLVSGAISHLISKEGHLWRKKDLAIPAADIDSINGDTVYLKLSKSEAEALPPLQ